MRQSEGRVLPAFSVANVSGADALLVSLWQSNTLRTSDIAEERNTTTVATRDKFRNLSAICCDGRKVDFRSAADGSIVVVRADKKQPVGRFAQLRGHGVRCPAPTPSWP